MDEGARQENASRARVQAAQEHNEIVARLDRIVQILDMQGREMVSIETATGQYQITVVGDRLTITALIKPGQELAITPSSSNVIALEVRS